MTPILQFGTSRFLQAHADLFIGEALETGTALGRITVVQSTADAGRARRLESLAAPGGYPVQIRGLMNGAVIDRQQQVTSIARTLTTAQNWAALCDMMAGEVQVVLSNTGDQGFAPMPADTAPRYDPAMSYPAKLLHLLRARFHAGGRPMQIMPCELIVNNGDALRNRVLDLATPLEPAFFEWLVHQVTWVNALVDRIVSAALEPAGAVAEPYALWAIADQPGLVMPCIHPAVQRVADLAQIEALKLFILNLGHSVMADHWRQTGDAGPQLVREWLENSSLNAMLETIYQAEVLPGFAAAGMGAQAQAYMATTMERFANPFLDHRLSDIAQNHAAKVDRRIAAFVRFAAQHGDTTPRPLLDRVIART